MALETFAVTVAVLVPPWCDWCGKYRVRMCTRCPACNHKHFDTSNMGGTVHGWREAQYYQEHAPLAALLSPRAYTDILLGCWHSNPPQCLGGTTPCYDIKGRAHA